MRYEVESNTLSKVAFFQMLRSKCKDATAEKLGYFECPTGDWLE